MPAPTFFKSNDIFTLKTEKSGGSQQSRIVGENLRKTILGGITVLNLGSQRKTSASITEKRRCRARTPKPSEIRAT